jgi:hypothetical protein
MKRGLSVSECTAFEADSWWGRQQRLPHRRRIYGSAIVTQAAGSGRNDLASRERDC